MDSLGVFLFILSVYFISTGEATFTYLNGTKNLVKLNLPGGVHGPESIEFDCKKMGPYVSVSDGRILRWKESKQEWKEFSVSSPDRDRKLCDGSAKTDLEPKCGRPLGIKFNKRTCELYVADAYFGLQVVEPSGGVARVLANTADGGLFRLTNGVDVDSLTGEVYFTDSSKVYQRRQFLDAVLKGDATGRLMKYDPNTKKVTVLWKDMAVPNGVALSRDGSFLLVNELGTMRILKFSLPRSGNVPPPEVFAELSRYHDNIKRTGRGEFWVALNSGRLIFKKEELDDDFSKIDYFNQDPVGIKFSESGKVVKVLDGNNGDDLESVSEVVAFGGAIWIGSVDKEYVGYLRN